MEPTAVALERLAAPDPSVRSHAIRSLAPELVHVVRERLAELARTDPHWSVRQAALETLLRFDWQEAARLPARERTAFRTALEVFLNDPDWHVRLEAARALLRLDLEEAARTILEALQEAPEDTPLSTNLPLRDHLVRLTAESLFTAWDESHAGLLLKLFGIAPTATVEGIVDAARKTGLRLSKEQRRLIELLLRAPATKTRPFLADALRDVLRS